MFKEIKLQAKKLLCENYKTFLPLILLHEFFISLSTIAFDVLLQQRLFMTIVFAVVILAVELLILPILAVSVYKVGFCTLNNATDITIAIKQLLTPKNLFKIVIINSPSVVLALISAIIKYLNESFSNKAIYFALTFFMLFIRYIVSYKLFICNYHFVLNESSIKETFNYSVNKMKRLFFKCLCFDFSFILWDILLIVIGLVVSLLCGVINVNYEHTTFLFPTGYGLMLFYRPYRFLCELLFCKKLEKEKVAK